MSLRWVCSLKETNAGFVPKTQLVVKGFEDNEKKKQCTYRISKLFQRKVFIFRKFYLLFHQ